MKTAITNIYSKILSILYFKKEWEGVAVLPLKPYRLVFFSHFDVNSEIHDYVIAYLKMLVANNCVVVFISTSANIDAGSIDKIKPYCYKIILRKNIGLDFGSWRMAFDRYYKLLDNAEALLLLNDSCFGPLYDIDIILKDFQKKEDCVSGITLNYEVSPHLQSYFLYIPQAILKASFFKKFMQNVKYISNKDEIIYGYEIGFSRAVMANGLKLNAWVNNELVEKNFPDVDGKKNLVIWYSDLLLEEKLSPFIKKAVFTNSKHLIAQQHKKAVTYLQKEHSDYADLINKYLYPKNN